MHGRPREHKHKLREPKAAEAHAKKVAAIRAGTSLVLECRAARRYDAAALKASEKLLRVVPEIYTVWNYRREALAPLLAAGSEAAAAAGAAELALTQACLAENPKSYSTWHHRKWLVDQGVADLAKELALVTSALALDGRNFHAWSYRQFIARRAGRSAEAELAYSSSLVGADLSNYSAWHYRSLLLPRLYSSEDITTVSFDELMASSGSKGGQQQPQPAPAGSASQAAPIPLHVLDQEYELLHQAFAADSGDQSPWIYYRWLLGNSLAHLQQAQAAADAAAGGCDSGERAAQQLEDARAVLAEVLAREVARFAEALAADPDAKWPLLMTARLKEAQARLGLATALGPAGSSAGPASAAAPREQALDGSSSGGLAAEVAALYRRLAVVDPLRAGYYADAAAGRAFVVVQALGSV